MDDKQRILIVDDDPSFRAALRRALGRAYEVVAVEGGAEGLGRVAAGERFDLILCDLSMPEIDGPTFHDRLVALAPELVPRLVLMTADVYTREGQAFLARTAVPWLEKPFSLDVVRKLMDERGPRAP